MRSTQLIGQSDEIKNLDKLISRAALSNSNVLIEGETGTGKEVVAKLIHLRSERRERAFVAINCAAIPENLLEAELFGYKRGAFTGASTTRLGLLESSDGGTIFLDEIGDMPLNLQPKLLRALQDRRITPLGTSASKKLDFRLISASHHSLQGLAKKKLFREDLFYRLNVVYLKTTPLRDRIQDIPFLIDHFSSYFCESFGRKKIEWHESALAALQKHNFDGNIRELENLVERAYALFPEDKITDIELRVLLSGNSIAADPIAEFKDICRRLGMPSIEELYLQYLHFVWEECHFQVDKAAQILGVSTKTIRRKLKNSTTESLIQ